MAMSISKKGFIALFVAIAFMFSLVALAPQDAYAAGTWKSDDKGFWYEYSKGKYYKNGWQELDGHWYYFNSSGYAREGWLKSGKKWYYLDGSTDVSVAKFNAMSKVNGTYAGYAKLSDGKVHKRPAMATGYCYVGGSMYYFNPNNGDMRTGWIDMRRSYANGWHYARPSGALATGWLQVKNIWYYFGSYDEKGYTAATGWQEINNAMYYFRSSCAMVTGWEKINNRWYYFDKSGVMQTNKWIGNYYVQADGSMATNAWIGNYHVDKNGKWDKTRASTVTTTTTGTNTANNTNTTTR